MCASRRTSSAGPSRPGPSTSGRLPLMSVERRDVAATSYPIPERGDRSPSWRRHATAYGVPRNRWESLFGLAGRHDETGQFTGDLALAQPGRHLIRHRTRQIL